MTTFRYRSTEVAGVSESKCGVLTRDAVGTQVFSAGVFTPNETVFCAAMRKNSLLLSSNEVCQNSKKKTHRVSNTILTTIMHSMIRITWFDVQVRVSLVFGKASNQRSHLGDRRWNSRPTLATDAFFLVSLLQLTCRQALELKTYEF